ncbi:hypothetical protein FGG08_001915 [Glutinoglossum americanum]|uniref:Uncharacterized protein n=1 Tax=Glutinoglossum americanum TaxID=1670608 RepID=A0A9P8I5T5_9PEZI|nr:hypothetical protein FGG08_001915 [Glutinoglossum americanum]
MSREDHDHLDIEDGEAWNPETRVGDHDTEQARHPATLTRGRSALEKVHDEIIYPISKTGTVFGEQLDPMDEQRQGPASEAIQVPQTPNRGSPNIGRKRSQNPALLRAAASPGHSTKMAQIFHHAQITLRNDLQPSGSTLGGHSRKSRLPVLHRRVAERSRVCVVEGQKVGQVSGAAGCTSGAMATILNGQIKQSISFNEAKILSKAVANSEVQSLRCVPVSDSGHRRRLNGSTSDNSGMEPKERSVNDELITLKGDFRDRVVTEESTPPILGSATPDFGIWDDEDDSELYYARRSIAIPTPMASKAIFSPGADKSNVDKWLEDMLSASPRKKWRVPAIPGLDGDLRNHFPTTEGLGTARSASQAHEIIQFPPDGGTSPAETDVEFEDSDKENQKPSNEGVVGRYSGPRPKESLRLRNPTTPHRSRIPTLGEKQVEAQMPTAESPLRAASHPMPLGYFLETPRRRKRMPKGAVPAPLPEIEEVVKLSPDVDPYRKANRPRRDRCASYYDEDIILSPEKRGVLTESNMSRKLTRAMAFCEEAEDYEFTGVEACE